MRGKLHARSPDGGGCAAVDADRAIAAIAGRQRGVVIRAQLLGAGIHRRAIERRLRAGSLYAVHRGIYLVGHRVMAAGARELAALLACGRGSVVSHLSAANLLQLLPYPANPRPVDVTLVGRQTTHKTGIRVHRVRALDPLDIRTLNTIPVTTPPGPCSTSQPLSLRAGSNEHSPRPRSAGSYGVATLSTSSNATGVGRARGRFAARSRSRAARRRPATTPSAGFFASCVPRSCRCRG